MDPRTQKLAKLVVNYSLKVKSGENVVISGGAEAGEFIEALYKEVVLAGANPILRVGLPNLAPFFYKHANDSQLKRFPKEFEFTVKNAQKYIGIDTDYNTRELSGVDPKKIAIREKISQPISNYIVNEKSKIRRSTVGYPCQAMAQDAGMSLTDYEDFVFDACLQDWEKLGKTIDKILATFKKGREVHLIGENVDLKFKIHSDKAAADKGEENMPGGEVFMAPVRESAEGYIKFEYPSIRSGNEVTDIYLKFSKGKVVEAKASKGGEYLKQMIKVDKNASYIGEFGIGCNPKITKYTNNLLFDEKIGGTIHLALGMAYKENGGGNDSALHWDIVKDMTKSKTVLDGKTVQEKGIWKF